jgi:hypothetical protein
VAEVAAAQPQNAVRQDAAFEEGVEFVLDELRQFAAGAGFGVRDEAGRVLLRQTPRRFWAATVCSVPCSDLHHSADPGLVRRVRPR